MTETALGLVKADSFQVPALSADIGPEALKRPSDTLNLLPFPFSQSQQEHKNTRIAYYHAIGQFLDWCQRAGFRGLEDIEPITVAAYVEQPNKPPGLATVKQHMSAIRMLFSWLTEKGILAMNPAREVLDKIDTSNEVGLRDRALLGTLAYIFARIGAVVDSPHSLGIYWARDDDYQCKAPVSAYRFYFFYSRTGRCHPEFFDEPGDQDFERSQATPGAGKKTPTPCRRFRQQRPAYLTKVSCSLPFLGNFWLTLPAYL
jgi:hypothetical protein